MKSFLNRLSYFILPFAFSAFLISLVADLPFYWDNVIQISVPANFYFDNDFSQFFLPDAIATGHPTFVGMYFAACWKLFGRTLAVSHWAMFPFVFGVLYQLFRLIQNLNVKGTLLCISMVLIVLLDTTFLSQLSLITFDVIQLFFFLACLNLLFLRRSFSFAIYFIFLMLVSLRGSIIGFGLLLAQVALVGISKKRRSEYYKYLPGLCALGLFLIAFKINKGWLVHNTASGNWESAGEFASLYQMGRNVVAMGWQLTDYGRIIPYALLAFLGFKWIRNRSFENRVVRFLFIVGLSQLVVLAPILIIYNNPFGHRYFLAVIIPWSMLGVYWVGTYSGYPKSIITAFGILLISGHFWIYPLKKSQGWDASTLHWKYMEVAEQMHTYILDQKIAPQSVGTFFPAYISRRLTHLESTDFAYSGIVFESEYLLFSNAFNVEDSVIDRLFEDPSSWAVVHSFSSRGVFINLYRRKAQ